MDGFIITNSLSGGTGSGFTSLLLEQLTEDYANQAKFSFSVYPNVEWNGTKPKEVLNSVLALSHLTNNSDVNVFFDNEALNKVCKHKFKLNKPSLNEYNSLIGSYMACLTATLRNKAELGSGFREIITNLVPFSNMNYVYGCISEAKGELDVEEQTKALFSAENQFLTTDQDETRYISGYLSYQGVDFNVGGVNNAIKSLKTKDLIRFVDSSRFGFKLSLLNTKPSGSELMKDSKGLICSAVNSTAMCSTFNKLKRNFVDLVGNNKELVQTYMDQDLDDNELDEAMHQIGVMENLYKNLD